MGTRDIDSTPDATTTSAGRPAPPLPLNAACIDELH